MPMKYALDYPKSHYEDKNSVCEGVVVDYLSDYIPSSLIDYINYEGVADMLKIEVIEQEDKFIAICNTPFDDLEL